MIYAKSHIYHYKYEYFSHDILSCFSQRIIITYWIGLDKININYQTIKEDMNNQSCYRNLLSQEEIDLHDWRGIWEIKYISMIV